MSIPVELPELGESVVEGTIARWLVKEGDRVELDQPVVEVTTDKVDAEIPAPSGGVIEAILVAEGETVAVGTVLARIDPAAEAAIANTDAVAQPVAAQAPDAAPSARPTPAAARMAAEQGTDLTGVSGSGVGGRITKDDVAARAAMETRQPPAPAPPPVQAQSAPVAPPAAAEERPAPQAASNQADRRVAAASVPEREQKRMPYASVDLEEGDRVIPMTPIRRLVAEHMVYSKRTSPHVGTVAEIDLGGVVAVRAASKAKFEETHGVSLTYLPFIVHATVRALREHPRLNASVIEDAIVEKRDLNIGIAVETEKGLVVPVVRNADRLSLAGLAAAIEDLSTRARTKKLTADDLKGGTFTVSNPGRHGNLYGFAIINQPQVGILRMGEIVKRPVVRTVDGSDAIVIRPMMHLALSYDHRAVDGAPANGFLYRVREILEEADFDL